MILLNLNGFEIGDIVELYALSDKYEVVGVIHDQERLFIIMDGKEKEVSFNDVLHVWRKIL